nr:hypothetical protein [Candidatus Sigynarchaeota archaeon]
MVDFKDMTKRIKNFGKNEPTYWGCALAGEVGEACNIIKKLVRDGMDARNKKGERYIDLLPAELADVFNYLELTARHFNIDLETEIIRKLDVIDRERRPVPAIHAVRIDMLGTGQDPAPPATEKSDSDERVPYDGFGR